MLERWLTVERRSQFMVVCEFFNAPHLYANRADFFLVDSHAVRIETFFFLVDSHSAYRDDFFATEVLRLC